VLQNRSLAELDKAYGHKQDIILWTSDLTGNGHAALYLDPSRYIIQVIFLSVHANVAIFMKFK
jgi:hexosaminidase